MAIVRLSIEILKGSRDSDDPALRDQAVQTLRELQCALRDSGHIAIYPVEETAPWGVPNRPDTFNLDFDTELADDGDDQALQMVTRFLTGAPPAP